MTKIKILNYETGILLLSFRVTEVLNSARYNSTKGGEVGKNQEQKLSQILTLNNISHFHRSHIFLRRNEMNLLYIYK